MPGYRLYFTQNDVVTGCTVISAPSDDQAVTIAFAIYEACDDVHHEFELWRLGRLVASNKPVVPPSLFARVGAISEKMQASLLATEEALANTRARVARSRKLIRRLAELKSAHSFHKVGRRVLGD
jgi:hypothetical protein